MTDGAQKGWSARVTVGLDVAHPRLAVGSLLGDVFLFASPAASAIERHSGLRASSGLILGAGSASLGAASAIPGGTGLSTSVRPSTWGSGPAFLDRPQELPQALPYLGIGYTHRGDRGAWGLSADLGWVADGADASFELGRALLGPNRLDGMVRNLRLRPVLQMGMHYRF
ncbi:MAG: hypothetical protein JNJ71_04890 [Rubrivivax sp.]|nr:hypothetical protein [Rubrivivax sp.]